MHAYRSTRRFCLVIAFVLTSVMGCDSPTGGSGYVPTTPTDTADQGDVASTPCSNGVLDEGESDIDCGGTCGGCGEGRTCFVPGDCASGACSTTYTCIPATCANGSQDPTEIGIDCGGSCPGCLDEACVTNADCASGYCSAGLCATPTCADGISNGAETGIDCGGACPQCGDGQPCMTNLNCLSGYCKAGFCATATCSDGAKNQNEADIDCGGPCAPCPLGKTCVSGVDCESGTCTDGICAETPASCSDGVKNGTETDVDCGGSCSPCGNDKACIEHTDCLSLTCLYGTCAAPTCTDTIQNQGETAVDCGGPCGGCDIGEGCLIAADCLSGKCEGGLCADVPASCNDLAQNGDETDIDCGGSCGGCPTGKTCEEHSDCLSISCQYGVCKDPTCDDEVANQGETSIDCGGPCPGCKDGQACLVHGDCASGMCEGNVCISCYDGTTNGSETDTDCGGSCYGCVDGKHCGGPGDCVNGGCEGGLCCSINACGVCGVLPAETCNGVDDDCDGDTDEPSGMGAPPLCELQDGVCGGATAICSAAAGWTCGSAEYGTVTDHYEATEATCDGLDNDCDGDTDEGMLNACGLCGPAPAELCNGLDDDCDGDTDEASACSSCVATPTPVLVDSGEKDYGLVHHATDWLTVLDDEAFLAFFAYEYGTGTVIARCSDGTSCTTTSYSNDTLDTFGQSSIAAFDGTISVSQIGLDASETEWMAKRYVIAPSTLAIDTVEEIATASDYVNAPVVMATGAGTIWAGTWKDANYNGTLYARTSTGYWTTKGSYYSSEDFNHQIAVDSNEQAYVVWYDYNFTSNDYIWFRPIGGDEDYLCAGECRRPAIVMGQDDVLHVTYRADGDIVYQTYYDGLWSDTETVATGLGHNVALSPDGVVFVSYTVDDGLWLATRDLSGTWSSQLLHTLDDGTATLGTTGIAVDSFGRVHLAFVVFFDLATDLYQVSYLMICPTL